jgi:hypothetical protein
MKVQLISNRQFELLVINVFTISPWRLDEVE